MSILYCLLMACLLGACCPPIASQTDEAAHLKRQNDRLYQEGLTKGKAQAMADIQANRVKYYEVGMPIPSDAMRKQILKEKYSVELVLLGCVVPPPPKHGLVVGYNSVISAHLEKKHGQDIIASSRAEAKAKQKEAATQSRQSRGRSCADWRRRVAGECFAGKTGACIALYLPVTAIHLTLMNRHRPQPPAQLLGRSM